MGMVCENCGWREKPNNNSGKKCVYTNIKKSWKNGEYNHACCNYIMDTTLREHLKVLLGTEIDLLVNKALKEENSKCIGCKHFGLYENEVEYGYPSPCTGCKRRSLDRFERRK